MNGNFENLFLILFVLTTARREERFLDFDRARSIASWYNFAVESKSVSLLYYFRFY